MKRLIYIIVLVTGTSLLFNSCKKVLDLKPIDPDEITSATVFDNPESYTQFMAKCYAGLAVGGQHGGDGQADISGIDGGSSQ